MEAAFGLGWIASQEGQRPAMSSTASVLGTAPALDNPSTRYVRARWVGKDAGVSARPRGDVPQLGHVRFAAVSVPNPAGAIVFLAGIAKLGRLILIAARCYTGSGTTRSSSLGRGTANPGAAPGGWRRAPPGLSCPYGRLRRWPPL